MAQVLRRRGRIQVKLDAREREALLSIVDGLAPRLEASLATGPRAYDEPEMQAEYARWVRDSLSAGENTLPLTEAQALSWLRAFNHLRIAAGGVLGIEDDGWEESIDPATQSRAEYGILLALGYLQEELVAALQS